MENDIATAAASYVTIRIGVLLTFAYLFCRVLRCRPALGVIRRRRHADPIRADSVPEDRC